MLHANMDGHSCYVYAKKYSPGCLKFQILQNRDQWDTMVSHWMANGIQLDPAVSYVSIRPIGSHFFSPTYNFLEISCIKPHIIQLSD